MRYRMMISCVLVCALISLVSPIAATQTNGSLAGTIKDPAGAVVAGAQVTVRNIATGESRSASTDELGRFRIENIAPGRYAISVAHAGFKSSQREVEVTSERAATVEIKLEIEAPREEIKVTTKGAVAPNTEPKYRGLRDGETSKATRSTMSTIKRDVGTLTFKSGRISFLAPVMGRVVKAVFAAKASSLLRPQSLWSRLPAPHHRKDTLSETFEKLACALRTTHIKRSSDRGRPREADSRRARCAARFSKAACAIARSARAAWSSICSRAKMSKTSTRKSLQTFTTRSERVSSALTFSGESTTTCAFTSVREERCRRCSRPKKSR